MPCLAGKEARATRGLNFLLSKFGEKLGLHNDRHLDLSISEELEITERHQVNNRCLPAGCVRCSLVDALAGNIKKLIKIDGGREGPVLELVELAHTDLSKVTRVVLVEKNSVVVLTSCVTPTSWMLSVLALEFNVRQRAFITSSKHVAYQYGHVPSGHARAFCVLCGDE